MYGHSFFLKFKSYRLNFCNKINEFLIIFDCTLPLRLKNFVYDYFVSGINELRKI